MELASRDQIIPLHYLGEGSFFSLGEVNAWELSVSFFWIEL